MIKPTHNLCTLLDTRKYILKRNVMNLAYVIMLLFRAQAWGIIREFMVERSPTNVTNVEEPLLTPRPLLNIRKVMLEKNPYEFSQRRKALSWSTHTTKPQRICIRKRSSVHTVCGRLLIGGHISFNITQDTPNRSSVNVKRRSGLSSHLLPYQTWENSN